MDTNTHANRPHAERHADPGRQRRRAVSRRRAAAGRRPADRGRRAAGGGAGRRQHRRRAAARSRRGEAPGAGDLYPIGTEARLLRYVTARDGTHHAIVQGIGRIRRVGAPRRAAPGTVTRRADRRADRTRHRDRRARPSAARARAGDAAPASSRRRRSWSATVQNVEPPGMLADLVTSLLDLSPAEKQAILETVRLAGAAGSACCGASPIGWRCCACPPISATARARPWRAGSGNSCSASSSSRSRRSWARTTSGSPELADLGAR